MDGLGLAMFLPLLELMADGGAAANTESMGQLAFILDGIQAMGLDLSLTLVLLAMLSFFVLKGIARFGATYLSVIYQQYFIRKIRVENINALTNYRYQAFVTADAGNIQNTLSSEVGRVIQGFSRFSNLLQESILLLTYATLAFLANPEFAIFVVIGGGLSHVIFNTLYKRTKALSKKLVHSNSDFQGLLIQEVAFFKYLKATGSIRSYANNLIEKVYEIEDQLRKMGVLNAIMAGVREPLMIGIVVLVILAQVKLMGGQLSTIILSLLFFYRGLTALMSVQTNYNNFLSFSGSIDNMRSFVDELKAQEETQGNYGQKTLSGRMKLQNVHFSYLPETPILQDINLDIRPKETLALVGESGSGKSTMMNLMSGLLQPEKGRIVVDGIDLADWDLRALQERIGYITQEPVIFDDTVFNNVSFWAERTPDEEARVWTALKRASIADFVRELPDGLDTRLGQNGISLSGGQKQRISIARELFKEVDFLFMDEATSALDSETESTIKQQIDRLKGQYTIIIIAHRLSTIRNADRVVVLKQGRIEQMGTYADLIRKSVAFGKMVDLQEV
jgi:subfamily B ATP-binding cassette protein MsbA